MEDAKSLCLRLSDKHPDLALFGVYDGHAGDSCARYLEKAVPRTVGNLSNPTVREQLEDAMLSVDEELLNNPDTRNNGSTCVIAIVKAVAKNDIFPSTVKVEVSGKSGLFEKKESISSKVYQITVSNVGDSRALLLKKDGRWKLLTRDHKPSLPAEKVRIENAEGKVDNDRVDGQLALSRAMGDWNYKLNGKLKPHEQKVIATPEVSSILAEEGDHLLLCCDGIFEKLSTKDVCEFVHRDLQMTACMEPAMTLARLVDFSLDNGSKDNMTALCVTFKDGKEYSLQGNELLPGRFFEYARDEKFKKAYLDFAKFHDVVGEDLFKRIPKPIKLRADVSPREREFSSVLSQLKDSDRTLLMAMMSDKSTSSAKDGPTKQFKN